MNNQKGIAPIVVVLIIIGVLALGGGVWYVKEKKKTEEIKKQAEELAQNQNQQTINEETKDWGTYQDKKYGFEFKYPAEFDFSINKNMPYGDLVFDADFVDTNYHFNIRRTSYLDINDWYLNWRKNFKEVQNYEGSDIRISIKYVKDIKTNEISAKEVAQEGLPYGDTYIAFIEGGYLYSFYYWGPSSGKNLANDDIRKKVTKEEIMSLRQKDLYLLNLILTTFKFIPITEPENLKTYKNDEYNFEFKYPSDWEMSTVVKTEKPIIDFIIADNSSNKECFDKENKSDFVDCPEYVEVQVDYTQIKSVDELLNNKASNNFYIDAEKISNIDGVKYSLKTAPCHECYKYMEFLKANYLVHFNYYCGLGLNCNNFANFETILSTFKFID